MLFRSHGSLLHAVPVLLPVFRTPPLWPMDADPWGSMESESVSHSVVSDCDPMGCSPPGSSIRGILQASTLEWAAISSSRGPSLVSRTAGQFFSTRATLDFSPSETRAANEKDAPLQPSGCAGHCGAGAARATPQPREPGQEVVRVRVCPAGRVRRGKLGERESRRAPRCSPRSDSAKSPHRD